MHEIQVVMELIKFIIHLLFSLLSEIHFWNSTNLYRVKMMYEMK